MRPGNPSRKLYMTLFAATLLPALILLVTGGLLLWNGEPVARLAKSSLRSLPVALIALSLGGGWFLYEITQLGISDFGNYRNLLFILFLAIAVLSIFYVRDFLAVRGAAILYMMVAKTLLDAAYMQDPPSRLFMVGFVYAFILLALYLGTIPYRLRDFFDWLFAKGIRSKIFGAAIVFYGLLLCATAFSY